MLHLSYSSEPVNETRVQLIVNQKQRKQEPLFSKAEVSACRMRSFDISDAEIQIMSSINLRKSSASFSTSAIGCRICNAQQCWPMRLSGYHRL